MLDQPDHPPYPAMSNLQPANDRFDRLASMSDDPHYLIM
jgi:hypothetical protein